MKLEKSESLRFEMIGDDMKQKEEDVEYLNENEIQFKVILTEINTERKRFLIFNRNEGWIKILKSSNRKVCILEITINRLKLRYC